MNARLTAKILGWLAGAVALAWLFAANAPQIFPDLPSHQSFKIVFPAGLKGVGEPIVTTGRFGDGDFLAVRYVDAGHAVWVYDVWGVGGPVSPEFAVEAGKTRTLELDLPTLATVRDFKSHEKRPLRIVLDGKEIFSAPVYFHRRMAEEIYFATNPIGGGVCEENFRGTLATPDGRPLRGQPAPLLNLHGQIRHLIHTRFWFVLFALVLAIAIGLATRATVNWIAAHPPGAVVPRVFRGHPAAPHAWAAGTILVSAVVFATLLTGGTFRFILEESFGTFYDHQAASLLHAHLDVPGAALSGEAFVVNGKIYGYYGITPALLRVPLVVLGVAFGQVIRPFLLTYFIAALVAAYLLLCDAMRALSGPAAWPSRTATVIFLLASGLGSTLLFLGSRAYIYHEAILCGATCTLWTIVFALRYLDAPQSRNWIGALLCGFLAMHARPSSGLFALCTVGAVALFHLGRGLKPLARPTLRRHFAVGVLATFAILSFNGLSYLKFGTFDGSPLRYAVQYTPERLARFDGKNFHLVNVPHNFDVYFVRPDFRWEPKFPYFFLGARQGRGYPGAKIDLAEPALALPWAMPALFLAALACGWALLYAPPSRPPLAVLAFGVAPMFGALLTAIVTSHRYTGDFCPLLIACAAWGVAAFDGEAVALRRGFLAVIGALAALSIFFTLANSLFFQGEYIWGVPDEMKQNYQHLRDRVDRFFGTTHR